MHHATSPPRRVKSSTSIRSAASGCLRMLPIGSSPRSSSHSVSGSALAFRLLYRHIRRCQRKRSGLTRSAPLIAVFLRRVPPILPRSSPNTIILYSAYAHTISIYRETSAYIGTYIRINPDLEIIKLGVYIRAEKKPILGGKQARFPNLAIGASVRNILPVSISLPFL